MTSTKEMHDTVHAVRSTFDSTFTWDYERSRVPLSKLYEKAKTSQWNATTDLDWSIDVDPERVASELGIGTSDRFGVLRDYPNSPVAKFGDKEWLEVAVNLQCSLLSQFLHGEQGALLCTARITETVPWIDAKYYAATQVMDEARHVEVFARYLNEKMGRQFRINDNLGSLLDDILADSRWDITYLGMQIMVEGLALAAFGMMHMITNEPLLKKLLRYVMSDEARHVAFGVLSLQEFYANLTQAELRERQEFAFETAARLQRRFMQSEVWERMGVDPKEVARILDEVNPPAQQQFQTMLFSKIVPNCKKLGLIDAGDGWLRERFTEIGVIQFEDWIDTGEEYALLDEVARDRSQTA
jgi:P-aminobenzoate N-oxygenase AurF